LVGWLAAGGRADDLPARFHEWKKARKDRVVAEAERDALRAENEAIGVKPAPIPDELSKLLGESKGLDADGQKLKEHLRRRLDALAAARDATEAAWQATALRHGALCLTETPGLWPDGASLGRLAAWALAALAAGLWWAAAMTWRPRKPRWQDAKGVIRVARGLGWAVFVLLLVLGAVGLGAWLVSAGRNPFLAPPGAGEGAARAWQRWAAEQEARAASLTREADAIRAELGPRRKAVARAWARPADAADVGDGLRKALLIGQEAAALRADAAALEQEAAGREAGGSNPDRRFLAAAILVAGWAVVVLLALGPPAAVGVGCWWHWRRNLTSCPCCVVGRVARAAGGKVGCRNAKCGFRLADTLAHLYRLTFPTVGVIECGKTRLIASVYGRVADANVPAGVDLKILSADSPGAAKMARIAADHRNNAPTGAGGKGTPPPLLLAFNEAGRIADGSIVNVFDFAGETFSNPEWASLRAEALRMDGFLLVLDPTWDGAAQRLALDEFCEKLAEARGIPPKQAIPAPVAVCLTKIDLLAGPDGIGKKALEFLHALRHLGRDTLDLNVIEERSRLVEKIIEKLFGTWKVVSDLKGRFGANVRFFPVTPMGVSDSDAVLLRLRRGPSSLEGRFPDPFGVVEPLLWLLHMHGYSLFRGAARGAP